MDGSVALLLFVVGGAAVRFEALVPGDIEIGGIFPLHEDVERNASFAPNVPRCVRRLDRGVAQALAMVDAVRRANAIPLMADANLTLGLWIKDSCSDVGTALRAVREFTRDEEDCAGPAAANATGTGRGRRPVMALIGASHSEISIAIAQQLTLRMIPQISYSSTAAILSDKSRFPAFLRTIPNDEHQTGAMARLLSAFRWSWVGVVTTDGDYGRSALDNFLSQTSGRQICVAFKSVLPGSITNQNVHAAIRQTALTISNNPKVRVIVSFAQPTLMAYLFEELKRQTLAAGDGIDAMRRVWIASDSWSSMHLEDAGEIGHVIGFHFKTGNAEQAFPSGGKASGVREGAESSPELRRFYKMLKAEKGASVEGRPEAHGDAVFSVEMAVLAVAHAAVRMCRRHDCKTPGAVQPWQLLKALWMEEFELEGTKYKFDRRGDVNLGYDVSAWGPGADARETVAEYHPQNSSFTYSGPSANKGVVSRCSSHCAPGQFKKSAEGQHTCCYECINCTENYFSNSTDMDQCLSCDTNSEWSPGGSAACIPKQMLFFCWDNGFAIVLVAFCALGIVLALLISALFFHRRQTPIVRAAGGPLSQVILYSLINSFVSALLFVGRPNSLQCKTRQVLFGVSFTVCVACILVKTLQILLAFQFNPALQAALRKLYRPYAVVAACLAVQVATCVCWLVLRSPFQRVVNQSTTLLQDCHEGSYLAFGAMLGYIALLALVCFVCAFKCRKLPHQYNEARFITFSMLLYLISWLLFIPIYVTTSGVYLPAVEMVVILISNYGILSCHFFPKCYVMLFKKDKNTLSAFRKTLYEYTSKSASSVSTSEGSDAAGAVSTSEGSDVAGAESESSGVEMKHVTPELRRGRSLRRSSSV
ncbi:G-protein coupled receptor family C group 6 member A-like [Eucyclogobius newberryi]|uniref:G-protein coupled receptor family C group 6 member A-like n=1 Tax=Eucyclogobius newberryi TaxID=166745 RepID=UPI003B59AE1E